MPTDFDLAVVGLGYVGLPLAQEATRSGLRVVGLDSSEQVVKGLNAGRSHVDDLSDSDVRNMVDAGFQASTDERVVGRAAAIIICVPTPLTNEGGPDLEAVRAASRTIATHLQPGALVVLESTTYPGTTEEVVRPILEESGLTAGADFHLAFSPERIDPGNTQFGLRNTPKVVGGINQASTDAARTFYAKVVDTVVPTKGTREAEMAKLLENTYRHVNIALVNEIAVFCEDLGVDVWEAIEAAKTKPFGFQAFYPGPGVGGHCIPIDPNYLSYKVRTLGYPFRFVELAQEVNVRMPTYVAGRAQRLLNQARKPVNGSNILLLGVTYKHDIADDRESPAQPLALRLLDMGAELRYHDPHVPAWTVNGNQFDRVPDLDRAVVQADLVILLQPHREYDLPALAKNAQLMLDTRGKLGDDLAHRL